VSVDADFKDTEMQHGTEVRPYFEVVLLYYNIWNSVFLCTRLREMFDVATPVCKFLCSPTNLPILLITLHNR